MLRPIPELKQTALRGLAAENPTSALPAAASRSHAPVRVSKRDVDSALRSIDGLLTQLRADSLNGLQRRRCQRRNFAHRTCHGHMSTGGYEIHPADFYPRLSMLLSTACQMADDEWKSQPNHGINDANDINVY